VGIGTVTAGLDVIGTRPGVGGDRDSWISYPALFGLTNDTCEEHINGTVYVKTIIILKVAALT
jgi:hypothetical protein